ncbi:LuxR C-terminal-related transcriptional regulator [Micromonospora taraxaci]|uniref:LuxR C-terminal-related transcriptional regulator n=1 Tax=Micromonospora taraxaci TaxID=1316803 RepID=UPI0034019897
MVDPLPLCRRGVAAALGELGHAVDSPDDVVSWLGDADQAVVLGLSRDFGWDVLADLHERRPALPILVLIDKPDLRSYVRAVKDGAAGAVARSCSPLELQRVFAALLDGQALLPVDVVRSLATDDRATGVPSEQERSWLRQLADGGTVADLAERAGYSERMMFRHLRELYGRIPARNRTEALMYARDRGWI